MSSPLNATTRASPSPLVLVLTTTVNLPPAFPSSSPSTPPCMPLGLSNPARSTEELLAELKVDRLPTTEEVAAQVEERFLAPRKILKDAWLGGFSV